MPINPHIITGDNQMPKNEKQNDAKPKNQPKDNVMVTNGEDAIKAIDYAVQHFSGVPQNSDNSVLLACLKKARSLC